MRLLVTILSFALVGCAQRSNLYGPADFQRRMTHALARPNANPAFHGFYLAYRGDAAGLRAYFAEALRQAESPDVNVEAGEGLAFEFESIVRHVGDQRFAEHLSAETPEVRSAVGCFLYQPGLAGYPKTLQLLQSAPKVDFPMLRTYRGEPPPKK
jgi:hypothetical protein